LPINQPNPKNQKEITNLNSTKYPELENKNVLIRSFKEQMQEIRSKYIGYLFIPLKKDETLENREMRFIAFRSKRSFIRKLYNPLTMFGILIIFILLTWAVFAPLITKQDFNHIFIADLDTFPDLPPSDDHLFGTTRLGRDVFARLIWGARPSIYYSIFIVFLGAFLGVFFGLIAGYFSGLTDNIIMRLVDIFMAFPSLIIIVLVVTISNQNQTAILLCYGILGFPGYSRLVRASVLKEKNQMYVQAAKVSGSSNLKILYRHILPNCVAPIIVSMTSAIGGTILGLAGLSFLGFGFLDSADWGSDLNSARVKIFIAPWAAFVPGFGVFICVLGFMLLGDGLRDALDPRLDHS